MLPKPRNSRNYLLLTDFSALNAFPCAPKSGSSLLFPSVIWNVITHHFRVLQEPDTYVSLSASPPLHTLSLSPAVFVCEWRIVYFPPPHIFEHYPYHYLCKWLGLRQAVYRTMLSYTMTKWELFTCAQDTRSYLCRGYVQENLLRRVFVSTYPYGRARTNERGADVQFLNVVHKKWTRSGVWMRQYCTSTHMYSPVATVINNAHTRLDVM